METTYLYMNWYERFRLANGTFETRFGTASLDYPWAHPRKTNLIQLYLVVINIGAVSLQFLSRGIFLLSDWKNENWNNWLNNAPIPGTIALHCLLKKQLILLNMESNRPHLLIVFEIKSTRVTSSTLCVYTL